MYASITTGHTARELRRPIVVRNGDTERTIRRVAGRTNSRRAAINESSASIR